ALSVKTSNIVYTKKDGLAVADDVVEFQRENVKGRSIGANVLTSEKRLKLLRDVEVEMKGSEGSGSSGVTEAKVKGDTAEYDQASNKLELNGNIVAHIVGSQDEKNTDVKADHGVALLASATNGAQPTLKSLELVDNVWIETTQKGQRQATIETAYAFY